MFDIMPWTVFPKESVSSQDLLMPSPEQIFTFSYIVPTSAKCTISLMLAYIQTQIKHTG